MAKNRLSCLKWAALAIVICGLSVTIAALYIRHKIEHDDGQFFVYIRYWRLARQHEAQYNLLLDEVIADLPVYPGAELIHEDVERSINDFEPMDAIILPP